MDPGLIFIAAIIGFRILRVIQSQQKEKAGTNPMKDLSNRSMQPAPKTAQQSAPQTAQQPAPQRAPQAAQKKPKHKRNRDDPFDGMHGDVLGSNLTIDDIVS